MDVLSNLCFASSQGKQSPHIGDVLERFQQWNQMEKIIIRGIIDPALDRNSIVFMKDVAHGAIIQNSHATQIRLNAAQVLDIGAIPKGAMLAIEASLEEFPLLLQPVDDRVGVFLHAGGEDDELVPLADFAQELVAVRPFVYVVEDGVLGEDDGRVGRGGQSEGRVEFDFDHVARGHAAAFGQGVD